MERLPYIDEHRITIRACAADTWTALTETAPAAVADLPPIAANLTRLDPPRASGGWSPVDPDTAVAGFRVFDAQPGRRLALHGSHRLSRYELIFEIEETGPDRVELSATTMAEFPGIAGRIYQALVIGSGGHGLIVRRMIRTVKKRAERQASTVR